MTPNDIMDRASLKEWLDFQSHEVAVAIAHRAGMRVAPSFWFMASRGNGEPDLSVLATTRSLLTSGVAATYPTPEVRAAAGTASSVDAASADAAADAAVFAATAAARAAAASSAGVGAAADTAAFAATAAAARAFATRDVAARAAADTAAWDAVRYDASILDAVETGRAIFAHPLRPEAINQLEDDWRAVRVAWQAAAPNWQFWIDWYEAALEGRPLRGDWDRHWDLLSEIALIPDVDWTAGPDRVNARIAELAAKHRLREEVDELRAKNARLRQRDVGATPEHRAHNNPPELIEARAVREVEIAALRAHVAVEAIANELRLSKPEPEKLEQSAIQLSDALGSVLKWLGSKGDRAVDKLIDWGVPAGAIWLLSNQEKIAALISGVKNYLTLLGASG